MIVDQPSRGRTVSYPFHRASPVTASSRWPVERGNYAGSRKSELQWPAMNYVQGALASQFQGPTLPVLFVGSGLSRRYAAADNWEGLLRHFAEMTPRPYEFYRSQAGGDLPAVATEIAQAFSTVWWDSPVFAESREKHTADVQGRDSPLKIEVAHYLTGLGGRLPVSGPFASELELLRKAVVDVIITTNYDDVLSTLFPDFRPFIGQDELLFTSAQGVGEIYQIHGSVTQPESLVLTAADYQQFDQRNAYLAAKLMTIFVEHPVVFLGYSLQDRNVVSILRSIAGCLTQKNIDQLRDRLIFVEWSEGAEPSIGPATLLLENLNEQFQLSVIKITVPDFVDVLTALTQLRRSFPARLLRRLKEQVYELVLTNDPHNRLVVSDIEDSTPDRDIDIVMGVGIRAKSSVGYVGLTRENLIDDVLADRHSYEAREVVDKSLPQILRFPGYVPVYKYLRAVDALDETGAVRSSAKISDKIVKMAEKISSRNGLAASADIATKASARLADVNSVADLETQYEVRGVFTYGTCMQPEKVDPDELRNFLNLHQQLRHEPWAQTQYIKLVCFLDWLENGYKRP